LRLAGLEEVETEGLGVDLDWDWIENHTVGILT